MTDIKLFTLEQANALLPRLKSMLIAANDDIRGKEKDVEDAYALYHKWEEQMGKIKPVPEPNEGETSALRDCRVKFQECIESVAKTKDAYVEAMHYWLDEVSETGVLLRDIKSGLLDFPAQANGLQYYLCWQANEQDIQFWHLIEDGYIGRRPLAVLSEYF